MRSQELRGLKLRFGELLPSLTSTTSTTGIDSKSVMTGVKRRAGFGTEEEVMPLGKDRTYGAGYT